MFMVMYAPGGIASLFLMNLRVASFGKLRTLWVSYLALGVTFLIVLLGAGAMIEMIYHLQLDSGSGDAVRFLGVTLHARGLNSWPARCLSC
jgi:branched-chain amino acid transport system permease protein